jgi:hypothetical protein
MKSVRWSAVLLAVACAVFVVSCTTSSSEKASAGKRNLLYLCSCGVDCKCVSVSAKPGECGCGKALKAFRLVKVEGSEALVCPCGPECVCGVDPKDLTKCGCGKALRRVNLKATGLYFCNCGGSCTCNTVSDQPGKCGCGMDLVRVN